MKESYKMQNQAAHKLLWKLYLSQGWSGVSKNKTERKTKENYSGQPYPT